MRNGTEGFSREVVAEPVLKFPAESSHNLGSYANQMQNSTHAGRLKGIVEASSAELSGVVLVSPITSSMIEDPRAGVRRSGRLHDRSSRASVREGTGIMTPSDLPTERGPPPTA